MKNKKQLDFEEEVVEVKDKNKFTTMEKIKFIIGAIFILFIGSCFFLLMYQNVWRPYPEIEDTYYLYHGTYDENESFKIKGKKWIRGEEKGEVIYNEKTGSLTLIYGEYDSDTHKVKGYWLNGNLTNGVAYLYSQDDNYYCYCLKGKTPTREQELSYDFTNNLNYTKATEDDTVCTEITGYGTYYQPEIEIPSKLGKYRNVNCNVIAISENAFKDCDWITSLTIPDSVMIVGKDAFTGCTSLIKSVDGVLYVDKWVVGVEATCKNAKIREGTVGIADFAFQNSEALEAVEMPNSVRYIGTAAFFGCKNLSSVVLSKGLSIIGDNSFNACTSLKTITIPSTVRFVGGYAFFGNSSVEVTNLGSTSGYDENWNVRESE